VQWFQVHDVARDGIPHYKRKSCVLSHYQK
jgi:hypothetical protein